MVSTDLLTAEELRSELSYDPLSGNFYWLRPTNRRIVKGSVAGTISANGYRYIKCFGKVRLAHRLAWLYVYGKWPDGQIDHANGIKTDNRIANIRIATPSQNNYNQKLSRNNTSGVKGVTWNAHAGKWAATIWVNKFHHHIGLFTDISAAANAIAEARENLHGEFANHG